MSDARVKCTVFVCVAVAHGVAFLAIANLPSRRNTPIESAAGVLLLLDISVKRKVETLSLPVPTMKREITLRPELSVSTRAAPVDAAPAESPNPDWVADRERAASEVVAKDADRLSKRSLFSRPETIELPRRGSSHNPGDSQRFDNGEVITWIDEDCYSTNLTPPGPRLDPNAITVVCKNHKKLPRPNLFDYLKPKSLRDPDAPPPKFEGIFSEQARCEYSAVRCD